MTPPPLESKAVEKLDIRAIEGHDVPHCEALLRSLPEWFGIEEAIVSYVDRLHDGLVARREDWLAGFLALETHFPASAEIVVMAVRREHHRKGLGRRLVLEAERRLRARGVELLAVKTLGPSRNDSAYETTRSFYEALGFRPLEEFPSLWGPGNPCLLLVKYLG